MKTHKIISVAALAALLAAGCGKEGADGRLRLVAEPMTAAPAGAKVLMDPAALDAAEWVAGETIDLCGTPYTIASDGDGGFCVSTGSTALPATLYAIYPATVSDALGNDIRVTNGSNGACAIDIHRLAVNFRGDGRHDVVFPMAATAASSDASITFRHLTGGLKLTLTNSTGAAVSVDRLVVGATQNDGSAAIYKDLRPAWATGQLPGIPDGDVGERSDDQGAQFVGDMTLAICTAGSAGVTLAAGQSVTFCIPMLASQLKNITVAGYSGSTQVFSKSKALDAATDIQRNIMYTIPSIEIN